MVVSRVVNQQEKEQMARLRDIVVESPSLTGNSVAEPVSLPTGAGYIAPPTYRASSAGVVTATDTDAMREILRNFYSASGMAPQVDPTPLIPSITEVDRELREALVTQKTPSGVRVGSWEIAVEESGDRKVYGVRSVVTGEEIASGLVVYEAAHALVKLLNAGYKVNHPEIRDVLALEEQYARNLADAVHFRKVLKSGKRNATRRTVIESRFTEARARAAHALGRLKRIVEEH